MTIAPPATMSPVSAPAEPPQKPAAVAHIAWLDGVRGAAALFVVAHHALLQVWDFSRGAHVPWPLGFLMLGQFSIAAFIVLSGFCLILPVARSGAPLLRQGAMDYFRRRFTRLVLPYWAAIIVSFILIRTVIGHPTGTHWDSSVSVNQQDVLVHALLLQDVLHRSGPINHAFWTVAIEWHLYMLLPVLLLMAQRLGRVTACLLGIGAGILVCLASNKTPWEPYTPFGALFCLGVLAGFIAFDPTLKQIRDRLPWGALLAVFSAITLGFCLVRGPLWVTHHGNIVALFQGPAVAALLIAGIASPVDGRSAGARIRALFGHRALIGVGSIGYSLYLLHAPILQLVTQYIVFPLHLGQRTAFAVTEVAGIGFSLLAAYVFWRCVELPAHQWAKRSGARKTLRQAS